MSVTFDQILRQANVALASRNPAYLAKEHRTCEAVSRLLVAVRAHVDSSNAESAKHEQDKAKLARENSVLAGKLADAEKRVAVAEKRAIGFGLEATDLPEAARARIMGPNGS